MKNIPAYSNGRRGKGGPRTKKQLKKLRERRMRNRDEQQVRDQRAMLIELERREPTLHDIDWKP